MAVEGRTHRPVIDHETCETCAVCLESCPAELIPDMRKEEESLRGRIYRHSDREVRLHEEKIFGPPRCRAACPIGQDVRGYLRLIARKRYQEALDLIRETNPLPSVCGYVCHHPCEAACVRGLVDDPLSIRALKRFAADQDEGRLLPDKTAEGKGSRVAVIGSGPAGLSAAHELARLGHAVEVIESYREAGGMLAWAIPDFRLPRAILRRDIEAIQRMGVTIRTGLRFGRDISMSDLREGGVKALVLSTGTQKGIRMGIENEKGPAGCLDCLDFLKRCADGEEIALGDEVLVVGGGNAAVDTARSALRKGAKRVTILYRRGPEEMPAHREEVEEALREGVRLEYLTAPVKVIAPAGRVKGLECKKTALGDAGVSGRRRPVPVEGSEFVLEADAVISAIGQEPDVPEVMKGLNAIPEGVLTLDPETMLTGVAGVFAAGDFLNGSATVVEAMASGKRAARVVDRYLSDKGKAGKERRDDRAL
ncbi:MAG: FAD-dependent oxidoreductase [Pseudomonadota bacterium]